MNDLAIIICNYNKKDYVLSCIDSVLQSDFGQFDLIVVDNASSDGSAEAVRGRYGDRVVMLENAENTGGAGGFSKGMEYAMAKEHYRFIHLLDNDVTVDRNAVGALYRFMGDNPQAGACASIIYRAQVKDCIQEFGSFIDAENLSIVPNMGGDLAGKSIEDSIECDCATACSSIFRVEVLQKSGVIDKDYFIYWDDVALSWAIRKEGYRVFACSRSIVWHYASFGERTAFNRYYSFRNKIHCFAKYLDGGGYEKFCKDIVRMLFRMFAVNRGNLSHMQNYFHALNDALNNIRGKAEPCKVAAFESGGSKFAEAFGGKSRILLLTGHNGPDIDRVAAMLRVVTDGEIDVFSGGSEVPCVNGVGTAKEENLSGYDITVQLCYHILDEPGYDRSKVYIDKYFNKILDGGDFDFFETYNAQYAFFHDVFYGFIKDKLDALRLQIRIE